MARFDWPGFLRQNNIEFVTSGPNTGKNAISIRCPFCGDADPSQHLGINLKGRGWGCLRNSGHRGKAPAYLVQKLLGCSLEEARRLTGAVEAAAPTQDAFAASYAALKATLGVLERPQPPGPLKLLPEFKPLLNGSLFAEPFLAYLRGRGYKDRQIKWLAENYGLHYATKGLYRYRVIIPIYDRYGALLSWTARTIRGDVQPRYRTLRTEAYDEGPAAVLPANSTILGLPVLWGAPNPRVLILVEGPFDALKVTAFGHALGVYGAALFGLNIYPSQVAEVLDLTRRFDKVFLLLDADAELQRLRLLDQLIGVRCQVLRMPPGSDDPGALPGSEIVKLILPLITAK